LLVLKILDLIQFLKKKNLHLVDAAKKFTEKYLNIKNCPTETSLYINPTRQDDLRNEITKDKKNIILGVGSSGPTTRWGSKNFSLLIKRLNKEKKYFFYLLCGPDEKNIANKILDEVGNKNCKSLSNKSISEVITIISICDIYIGNDSFGHHVASQSSIPSFIIILDTPKAYTDYSKNQYRIIPDNMDENKITHDSAIPADSISVDTILNKIKNYI
jgi:ADP-heptose:LPS heptosyltransferase